MFLSRTVPAALILGSRDIRHSSPHHKKLFFCIRNFASRSSWSEAETFHGLQGSYCLSKSKVNTSLIWSSATINVSTIYLWLLQFYLADILLKCDVFCRLMMSNGSEMMANCKWMRNLMSSGNDAGWISWCTTSRKDSKLKDPPVCAYR